MSSTHEAGFTTRQRVIGEAGGVLTQLRGSKYVLLCALTAAIGGLSFGYDQGVVSVILVMPRFLQTFPEMDATVTNNAGFFRGFATAILELGGVLGALIQSYCGDRLGRRRAMQVGAVIFVIAATIQTASQDYAMLVVGRFLGGVGVGMLAMIAPVYMGEISPAEIRGALLVLEEWCIVVGAVVAYWITYGTRYISSSWCFRLPFLIQIFPVMYLGIAAQWMPESPRWLATRGRNEEALFILRKIREAAAVDEVKIKEEYIDILADVAFHRRILAEKHNLSADPAAPIPIKVELASYLDLFKMECWLRTAVGTALVFFQQFVGINALIYYAPSIFANIGLNYENSLIMAGIMNIFQLIGVSASIFLMDKIGRRPLLLTGSAGMFASQLCLAIVVGLYSKTWPSHPAQGWVGVAFIWWYMIAFGISWGPIPWSMPAEIFPSSLRGKGTAFSQCMQWLFNFVVGLITPPMLDGIGFGTYVFFAVFCVLSGLWAWFLCPETRGKSLEQMDSVFKDHRGSHDEAHKASLRGEIASQIEGFGKRETSASFSGKTDEVHREFAM